MTNSRLGTVPLSASGRPIPPPPRVQEPCVEHDWHRTDLVSDVEEMIVGSKRLFWDGCSRCGKQQFVVDGGETLAG
jgi:hypothetical protein